MKKTFACAAALIFMFGCTSNSTDKVDEKTVSDTSRTEALKTETPNVPVDSAVMMKNWENYMTPSAAHKVMASWDGSWQGDVSMWQTADAAPQKSKSTTVNKMIMGGRYQQSMHTGNMMGMPFEGMSTMGYDNAKKTFTSTWIDNMGTGTMILEGPWDEASKTLTLTGKVIDPSAGNAKEMTVRETYKVIDDNNHLMEMYCNGMDGKEFKTMEIKFTKK